MTETERLAAIDALRQLKARYFRGVDTADAALVRDILMPECELDYRGCFTDPVSGHDHFPAMNVVLRRSAQWSDAMARAGIVTAHHGHTAEIEILDETHARAIWAMTDRLWFPPGGPRAGLIGYGHYRETYEKTDRWRIRTLRLTRLRVEPMPVDQPQANAKAVSPVVAPARS
ncbi:MAG: nuclear transport factor 2 family protein [Sphingomonas sp.]